MFSKTIYKMKQSDVCKWLKRYSQPPFSTLFVICQKNTFKATYMFESLYKMKQKSLILISTHFYTSSDFRCQIMVCNYVTPFISVVMKFNDCPMHFTAAVELSYNDHGYKELTAITNKLVTVLGSQKMDLLHKCSRLWRTYIHGLVELVVTEFDCTLFFVANYFY